MYNKLSESYTQEEVMQLRNRVVDFLTKEGGSQMLLTMSIHKRYKTLAHMIIEKAKQDKVMKKFDYEHIVKPFATILRTEPISEKELLAGFKRSRIAIVK